MTAHDLCFDVTYDISDINVPEFSWPKIRASYNNHADEVYGGTTDLKATIFNEDADAFFTWCDSNGDGQVSLYESASCGSKSAFWGPEGEAMASWTDMFTYGTEIAYDFVNIMLKYFKNLDLDGSGSLSKDEFRISYAKMALLAAHVEMDILDANGDGILQGNELKTFTTLTVRGANVCLPGYFLSLSTSDSLPVELYVEPVEFRLDTSSITAIMDSVSGYIWNNFLSTGPESTLGTGSTSGLFLNSRFRYQRCFQPRHQNAFSIWYHQRCRCLQSFQVQL